MAYASRKKEAPFRLRPGDGAIGGLQGAVAVAYSDFETLARNIAARIDMEL
jgi:chromosome partitioning protein